MTIFFPMRPPPTGGMLEPALKRMALEDQLKQRKARRNGVHRSSTTCLKLHPLSSTLSHPKYGMRMRLFTARLHSNSPWTHITAIVIYSRLDSKSPSIHSITRTDGRHTSMAVRSDLHVLRPTPLNCNPIARGYSGAIQSCGFAVLSLDLLGQVAQPVSSSLKKLLLSFRLRQNVDYNVSH